MLVFLGGTCGQNEWRKGFLRQATSVGFPAEMFFNPVVENWDEAAQQREEVAKRDCLVNLFYLADPFEADNRVSFYSLCEAIMGLYDNPQKTVVIFDDSGMPPHAAKSMKKAQQDLRKRFPDGNIFSSYDELFNYLARLV